MTDDELVQIGRDPFIAAFALMGPNRAVGTKEVSKPKRTRANKKTAGCLRHDENSMDG